MLYRHNKKEQDQLPAHTYEEAQKGKKKSSVLIQLSGWLRTLDDGAGGRTRTGTTQASEDFKSAVSTIPPHRQVR